MKYWERGTQNWVFQAEKGLETNGALAEAHRKLHRTLPGWTHVAGDAESSDDQARVSDALWGEIKSLCLAWYIHGHGDGWIECEENFRTYVRGNKQYMASARYGWFLLTISGWGLALLGWIT